MSHGVASQHNKKLAQWRAFFMEYGLFTAEK
jgi:hypothetical protein